MEGGAESAAAGFPAGRANTPAIAAAAGGGGNAPRWSSSLAWVAVRYGLLGGLLLAGTMMTSLRPVRILRGEPLLVDAPAEALGAGNVSGLGVPAAASTDPSSSPLHQWTMFADGAFPFPCG